MAPHSDSAVPVAPKRYAFLRPTLQPGDLLFCSGNYLISKAIQCATKSQWSHVGIILPVPQIGRVLLLESIEDAGVRLIPLSNYLADYQDGKPYDGELVVARHDKASEANLSQAVGFCADQLGRPYNNVEIAEILARLTLGMGRVDRTSGYICSELVNAAFHAAGLTFGCDASDYVTPEMLWSSPNVQPLARLVA